MFTTHNTENRYECIANHIQTFNTIINSRTIALPQIILDKRKHIESKIDSVCNDTTHNVLVNTFLFQSYDILRKVPHHMKQNGELHDHLCCTTCDLKQFPKNSWHTERST